MFNQHESLEKIPSAPRHFFQVHRRQLHFFVFQKAPRQFRLRVFDFFPGVHVRHRQKKLTFDFQEARRHHKIVGRQFKICVLDPFHIRHVLLGQKRHRNVHDVELLLADEKKKQIQRPFETLKQQFQRVGRDVEILRLFKKRFPVKTREHFIIGIACRSREVSENGVVSHRGIPEKSRPNFNEAAPFQAPRRHGQHSCSAPQTDA